jgi:large subunit ribosomal protein L46
VPEVGEMPVEDKEVEVDRYKWEKEDAARGEKSLERVPEGEVFCLVERDGKWELPGVRVKRGESLHDALERGVTGVEGAMKGEGLDTWLVTKKPIGMIKQGEQYVS